MKRNKPMAAAQASGEPAPMTPGELIRRLPGLRSLLRLRGAVAGWWFDVTRNVDTRGHIALERLTTVDDAGGFDYLPTFAHVGLRMLRNLPPMDYSNYTFIDLGSGKGRMLFAAAQYPFRRILGIEFATELHQCALRNIGQYRHPKRQCARIESLNLNALDYELPDENLVIYLFNPFGREAMQRVLGRIDAFIAARRREVVLIMLHGDSAAIVDALPHLRLYREGFHYRIYQSFRSD